MNGFWGVFVLFDLRLLRLQDLVVTYQMFISLREGELYRV